LELGLYRGFATGVVESKRVLKPERIVAGKGRMERVKAVLAKLNAVAAIRRFRIRRILRNTSTRGPPEVASNSESPRDVDQLRARLSAITAIKATQSAAAAAEAREAAAARKIENAMPIQSNLVLKKPIVEQPKMVSKKKPEPWDGTRAEKKWVHTYNRNRSRMEDWNSIPIPGMA